MKSNINSLIFTILSLSNFLFAQSKIVSDKFYSISLDTIRAVNIYLPENYDSTNADERYPVVYFLHGGGGDHTSYKLIVPILDSLISNQIIDPLILVKPDGSCKPYLGSQYMNSDLYGNFEDFISDDLIKYVDSKYQTISKSSHRGIMGHSMGGEGAIRAALKHPSLYSGVASHGGVLSIEFIQFLYPLVLAENDSFDVIKPTSGYMSNVLFTATGGYSPNINNPPYFVDLPMNSKGDKIDSVWVRWQLNDPAHLATKLDPQSGLSVYLDCGTNDPIFYCTTIFTDTLNQYKIPYEFHSYEGGHNDKLSERFPISLEFLNKVMKSK